MTKKQKPIKIIEEKIKPRDYAWIRCWSVIGAIAVSIFFIGRFSIAVLGIGITQAKEITQQAVYLDNRLPQSTSTICHDKGDCTSYDQNWYTVFEKGTGSYKCPNGKYVWKQVDIKEKVFCLPFSETDIR